MKKPFPLRIAAYLTAALLLTVGVRAETTLPSLPPLPESTGQPEVETDNTPQPEASAFIAPADPMTLPDVSFIVPIAEPGILHGIKIGIDPGHQAHANNAREPVSPGGSETKPKVSSGTQGVSTRVNEYEVNLQIALLLKSVLEMHGAEVYLTRDTNDIDISNVERALMMNELGVAVVLRLHCNGSENQNVSGIGLYVKSAGEGAAESYAISEMLLPAMGEATGAKTESIHVRDTYSGLNWSTVPSILVEMGYMSNPEEDEALCSDEYQALLVEGMVNGLIDYFVTYGIAPVEPEPTPEPALTPTQEPTAEPIQEALASALSRNRLLKPSKILPIKQEDPSCSTN